MEAKKKGRKCHKFLLIFCRHTKSESFCFPFYVINQSTECDFVDKEILLILACGEVPLSSTKHVLVYRKWDTKKTRIFFFVHVFQSEYKHTYTHTFLNSPISLDTDLFSSTLGVFYFYFLRVAKHKGNQWKNVFFCVECFFFIVVDDQHFEVCSVFARLLLMSVFISSEPNLMCATLLCARLAPQICITRLRNFGWALKLMLNQLIPISRSIKTVREVMFGDFISRRHQWLGYAFDAQKISTPLARIYFLKSCFESLDDHPKRPSEDEVNS